MITEDGDLDSSDDSHSTLLSLSTSIYLQCLTLQSQSEPDDQYGIAEAAAVGLKLLVDKYEERCEELYSLVIPFIQSNATHDDWRKRDAAIMAFGTIVGLPESESQRDLQLIQAMIPILLNSSHPNHTPALVRSSSVWAIGRLFQEKLTILLSSNIDPTPLLNGLTNSLSDSNTRVQEQVLTSITQFGETLPEEINGISSQIIVFLLVQKLFQFTNPNLDSKVKVASYDAMSCLIESNPLENEQQSVMIFEEIIRRLESALEHSTEDLEPLCGLLSSSFNCISSSTLQTYASTLVHILLRSISYAPSDSFLTLGKLISVAPQIIRSHHSGILGAVIHELDSNPCQDAISFVGDICHSLLEGVTPYANTLIPCLLRILYNPTHRFDNSIPILFFLENFDPS